MYLEPPLDPREEPGPEREPALTEQLGRFLRAANGAFAGNTERALKSDLAIYAAWCAERGERALPASPETVAAFVDAKAEVRAPATVRRYVTSLVIAHRALGVEKTLKSPPVQLALKRMHRKKGRRQDQATGLTWPLRQRLLEAAGDRTIDDRNRALLAVAYDAMLRRAELVSLQVPDLLEELQGDGSLLVRRSKTDGEGRGEIVWVGADTVRLVRTWLDRAGIADGMLFRSVGKGGRIGARLHPGQVPRIFKAMAREAGLPEAVAGGLSGHSARVGAAQDMVAAGIELPAILHAGRWKSTAMVNRYGERLLARRSGAAQLARMQERG
ncbi:MAG: tyrosine-type recombinase/integrase [Defluviicoccus sp.]|nr:tyrosine-type recombinase/integrase [Defluviicoccus sp.]